MEFLFNSDSSPNKPQVFANNLFYLFFYLSTNRLQIRFLLLILKGRYFFPMIFTESGRLPCKMQAPSSHPSGSCHYWYCCIITVPPKPGRRCPTAGTGLLRMDYRYLETRLGWKRGLSARGGGVLGQVSISASNSKGEGEGGRQWKGNDDIIRLQRKFSTGEEQTSELKSSA